MPSMRGIRTSASTAAGAKPGEQRERLLAVGRLGDLVPLLGQDRPERDASVLLVVDDEDPFLARPGTGIWQ